MLFLFKKKDEIREKLCMLGDQMPPQLMTLEKGGAAE